VAKFSEAEQSALWEMFEAGVPFKKIGRELGRQHSSVRRHIMDAGGKRPAVRRRSELRLSLAEREEISRGLAAGDSLRQIAADLERSPSTVCREVHANGGRRGYRALAADKAAWRRARRPKMAKLARCRRLRGMVEAKLAQRWSPEEISGWLARTYPNRPELQVSHETIYQSLFVQGKGSLRKELHSCLRTGRAMRRAKGYTKGGTGRGQLTNMVMISERPAEVVDRAVPGHWEGDLIFGKKMTAIGTLVERHSRYVVLLKLPNGHGAEEVRKVMTKRILTRAAPALGHLGSRQGDGRARPVHRRHRCAGLLLRPEEPVAARNQREHQRTAPSVLAEEDRPLGLHPARPRQDRPFAQHKASKDARLHGTM